MTLDRVDLSQDQMPRNWYNILPDLPEPMPTFKEPVDGPPSIENLKNLFTKAALDLEFSDKRWIKIPQEVLELYLRTGRPRPLYRARRLEKYLKTSARIYYKREDLAPTGSFKMNTTIPQTYYALKEGYREISVYTGAGQTGTAAAYAAALLDIKCTIFWVRHAYNLKPDRITYNKMLGANVIESPSNKTETGRSYYRRDPNHPGNLVLATAESFEYALKKDDAIATWGSRMNHVIIHQSIIGLETKKQLELIDERPDVLISCVGGGSNFSGLTFPFIKDHLNKKLEGVRFLGVESEVAPKLTRGTYRYDFAESSKMTPMMKMYTMGVDTPLPTIRAEGIRTNSISPALSLLRSEGIIEAVSYPADEVAVFEAAKTFLEVEGVLVAPETSYAVRAAMDQAIEARRKKEEKVIVVNLSGSGYLDLKAYGEVLKDL
ncbi:MAG TPA: TrpB-like pyridoxal phosphate-dependent enzyme [Candidatus Bathyarchaeia archaeon]|nr:TrpB-like pyridoxal phosphate-dependent enzyme [Candidatus Bathyarchaeia archaeon]